MKTYKIKYSLIIAICLFGLTQASAQILDPIDFGFEETSVTDWTQVAGFTEETTIVASGLKSMKASMTYPMQSPKLQTYRGSATSNGSFTLTAGNYTLSAMVYLTGDAPTGLKISPTSAPIFPNVSLEGLAQGQWVKTEVPFTVADIEAQSNIWVVVQFIGLPSSGTGTVYIDDIVITGEVEEKVPVITKIETLENANLNLETGLYNMSMNVWVDPAASMTNFYTTIETPWTSIKWDIQNVNKGEWIPLNKEFALETQVVNSKFNIQVSNIPGYGGGIGAFYIDDILIAKVGELSTDEKTFIDTILLVPNPANDFFSIKISKPSHIIIYNAVGTLVKQMDNISSNTKINISNLSEGMYFVKVISNDNNVVVKKLIIN